MKGVTITAAVLVVLVATMPAAAQTTVFINEIHYDNDGIDAGEAIEIAGPAGTDLTGWSLVLYNGSGGAPYNTTALFGSIADTCNGFGALDFPIAGIQNGSPDGIALVDAANTVVQFLSYEGSFTAVGGPANGLTSTDIGVSEPGTTPIGDSLQLAGTGFVSEDFTWAAAAPNTFGACNTGQNFGTPSISLVINEIDYDQPSTDAAEFIEIKNTGSSAVNLDGFAIDLINGTGGGAAIYQSIALPAVALAPGDYFVVCGDAATTFNCDLDVSPDSNLVQNGAPDAVALWQGATLIDTVSYEGDTGAPYTEGSGNGLVDDGGTAFLGISRFPDGIDTGQNNADLSPRCITPGAANIETSTGCSDPFPAPSGLVINEIDYDQPSTDTAEFVELKNAGTTAVDLSAYTLELVNGTGGGAAVYQTFPLPAVALAPGDYFVVCGDAATTFNCDLDVSPDSNLVQNGAPDAVALWQGATLIDTVSYEGDTGAPYTEGSGNGLVDDGGTAFLGISRFPDGIDTGRNNADLSLRCITPGAANSADASGCFAPGPPTLVINEIDYDQPGTDAAEFVEIKNTGSSPVNLDGINLELVNGNGGGAAVYQTFPLPATALAPGDYFVVCANAATVLNCDLDVTPDSNLAQNGAPDAVALWKGATLIDTVSYEGDTGAPYTEGSGSGLEDNGATAFLGISRVPDGTDTDQNNVDLSLRCITPGAANTIAASGCTASGPVVEIFDIQGAGPASPFAGSTVTSNDNIVTALGLDGFFMQTPTSRADGNIDTSDGIFVFTGGAPAVAVGDLVDVTGAVQEFFGLTEISGGPSVWVDSSGNPLPPAVAFNAAAPSPDPTAPSCAIEYECYEGMLVAVADGTVTGPNQRFNTDTVAEVHITAAPERTFREPGVLFPGLGIPPIPTWDGNPEVFELDPNKLGLPNLIIPAGSAFSATGVLGFEFNGYELWPTWLEVDPAPLPVPVRARASFEFTIGSLNLFRLFDDIDDPPTADANGVVNRNDTVVPTAEYLRRRAKLAAYILDVLDAPDILAVQEAEKIEVLEDLAADIAAADPGVVYTAWLIEGNDVGTIDVGFLTRDTIAVDAVTQYGYTTIFSFDGSLLNDRPPLMLEARYVAGGADTPVKVVAIHNRSLGSIDDPTEGPRVRQKRLEQAQFVAQLVQDEQTADPDVALAVVGDFNAYEFTDGYVDVVGQIAGDFEPAENLLSGLDLVDPNLTKRVLTLPADERYSFIFTGSAQTLDHALTSTGLDSRVAGFEFGRGNADAAVDLINDGTTPANLPLRSSDHDGLVLYLTTDQDGDGVADSLDSCPGTTIPESVPTIELRTNHWALVDGDGIFDTSPPNGLGAGLDRGFTITDTAGCSCEQIIDQLLLGNGHTRFGCSTGAIEDWIEEVQD